MGHPHIPSGPFDVPDVASFVPRRLKPWIFIIFVVIIQLSGGVYLAAASDMIGSTALMQEDIMMAGFASLVGMSTNFAVMFRIKFRFSTRIQLLAACSVLIIANFISAHTDSAPVLVASCFVAGWFRMQATFACNSTIQLWLTPVRDMSIFFSYVYLVVDGTIQLTGISAVYAAFDWQWEYMQWIMTGLLALMMIAVMILIRPVHQPLHIPLLGIDWLGALLWAGFGLSFTFVCVYGDFYDWWDADEIRYASLLGLACAAINLWRTSFLRHPYISLQALTNRNVVRATLIYLVFFTLMATEHVFEHAYAASVLGFDETNLIDLNWYVFAGILTGCAFTYLTFARRRWRYKTMVAIAFAFAAMYLAWFYFMIDYNVEKEMLFLPLFLRGVGAVVISIVFLTSIVQSGLPFQIFPQALAINGFVSAVMSSVLGSAIVGEWLSRTLAADLAWLGSAFTAVDAPSAMLGVGQVAEMLSRHAMLLAMKEIYGWLLIGAISFFVMVMLSYSPLRPWAIFPKWKTIRRIIRRTSRDELAELAEDMHKNIASAN